MVIENGDESRAGKRKSSFYGRALDEAERLEFEEVRGMEGLDEEIALLRLKLRSLIESHPENVRLALDTANTLARLVRTRYSISREQKRSLKQAITRVLTEIAVPLGVKVLMK